MDEPINFKYEDTDSFRNEISELYSYSEESEFYANRNCFEESMEDCGFPLTWNHMSNEQKRKAIYHLLTMAETSCKVVRVKSCRSLAYLIQGNFGECLTLEQQEENSKTNCFLLYKYGIFQAFIEQLMLESRLSPTKEGKNTNKHNRSQDIPSNPTSIQIFNDSTELRLMLSVLCTVAETMYHAKNSDDPERLEMRQQFIFELQNPLEGEFLVVTLFQMLDKFCSGQAPHYPVRKITLLLWKLILLMLGGTEDLKKLKDTNRKMCNLDPTPDDTLEIIRNMTPCIPPMNQPNQAKSRPGLASSGIMANKRKVFKQTAFDDAVFACAKEFLLNSLAELRQTVDSDGETKPSEETPESISETNTKSSEEETEEDRVLERFKHFDDMDTTRDLLPEESNQDSDSSTDSTISIPDSGISNLGEGSSRDKDDDPKMESEVATFTDFEFDLGEIPKDVEDIITAASHPLETSGPSTNLSIKLDCNSQIDSSRSDVSQTYRGLPWTPKVRKADLCQHITNIRVKFLGYALTNDLDTTFGLPKPIVEGIDVLKKHLYVSLAEAQLEREEKIQKYPITYNELNEKYNDLPTERLYQALLPRLPQYMIALLKILLAASTNGKHKPDKVELSNIMAEINPDVSSQSVVQLMKMTADSARHEGVIIKATSAILLLLLKHFKINHIYQFEYISQQLMFANCIPLILKFLSQDIHHYIVQSRSSISAVDFPACVIGEPAELTADALELSSFQPFCWRNMFSCINLVRILNKLTKWKYSRIMMLVVFKSSQTLLKALNVRHSMFQLYVLKLLKVQLKFLGRQWKKNNMKLISPIYQKVRHRLTDDWAYSNDNEARPWDFQEEEFTLQNNINRFHTRRYRHIIGSLRAKNTQGSQQMSQNDMNVIDFDDFFTRSLDLNEEEGYDLFESGKVVPYFSVAYEKWLEGEVHQRTIDWDKLLECY